MYVSVSDLMLPGPHVLKEGECYFDIVYHEEEARFPCVETYVYLGTRTPPRRSLDRDQARPDYYFQDVESYVRYGDLLKRPPSRRPKEPALVMMGPDSIDHLFDIRGVAEALARLGRARP